MLIVLKTYDSVSTEVVLYPRNERELFNKIVLPALVPELSYNDLEIKEGGTASNTFLSMVNGTFAGDVEETRNQLLEYCKLDTYRDGQNSGETTTGIKLIFFQKIEKIYF